MNVATLGLKVDASGAIMPIQTVKAELKGLGAQGDVTTASLKSLGTGFLAWSAAAGVATEIAGKFVRETIAAQDAQAQLEAAVRSTGGAAGRSVDQLQALATQLQSVSTFSDEAVQGAEAVLLTFTKIKGSQFDNATRAVVDLATRMGGDLKGAALQVGKALQDPEHGLTALTRAGVSFSAAQKDVIRQLNDTGHSAEAQRLILAELGTEFGGSAAAARDTLGGALKGLTNAFGDLFEISKSNSRGLIDTVNSLSAAFERLNGALGSHDVGGRLAAGLSAGVEAITAIGVAALNSADAITLLKAAYADLKHLAVGNPFNDVTGGSSTSERTTAEVATASEGFAKAAAAAALAVEKQRDLNQEFGASAEQLRDLNLLFEHRAKLLEIESSKFAPDEIAALKKFENQLYALKQADNALADVQKRNAEAYLTYVSDIEQAWINARPKQAQANAQLNGGPVDGGGLLPDTLPKSFQSAGVFLDKYSVTSKEIEDHVTKIAERNSIIAKDGVTVVDSSAEWLDHMRQMLDIANAIADALASTGSEFGKALQVGVRSGGQILDGLSRGNAAETITGITGLIQGLDLFGTHAKAVSQQLREEAVALAASYKAAFDQFAGVQQNPEDAIHSDAQALRDQIKQLYTAQEGPLKGQILATAAYNAELARINATEADRIAELRAANLVTANAAQVQRDLAEATERARQAAEAETARRNSFDLTNGALGFSDPRAASAAAFQETQNRRLADATDKAAAAAYNFAEATQRAADIAAGDLSTSRTLAGRLLTASGNTRGAEDVNRLNSQTTELAQAIRDGMSPTNVALLQYTQFAENAAVAMQRTIEDGTKAATEEAARQTAAVDQQIATTRLQIAAAQKQFDTQITAERAKAQIDAAYYDSAIATAREATKAQLAALDVQAENARTSQQLAKESLAAAQAQVQKLTQVKDSLDQFAGSLSLSDLSTLSPAQKLAEARSQFDALVSAARSGDTAAAGGVGNAASAFLAQSRTFNGSTTAYSSDFSTVQATVAALQSQYGTMLGGANGVLSGAQSLSDAADSQLAAIQAQKDAVNASGTAQVDALQQLKDAAAKQGTDEIAMLQAFKEAAAQGGADQLDALTRMKDVIAGGLSDSITTLTSQAREAYQSQLAHYDENKTAMAAQLTAQQAQVVVLQAGFSDMRAQIDALIAAVNENTASTRRAVQESVA